MFTAGDIVTISYTGYTVDARVIEPTLPGWLKVEQITDYEDHVEGDRPVYEAAEEFCVPQGDPPAPAPFQRFFATGGSW